MDRMKTLLKYAIWIILFYIFSNLMIRSTCCYNITNHFSVATIHSPNLKKSFVFRVEQASASANGRNGLVGTDSQ